MWRKKIIYILHNFFFFSDSFLGSKQTYPLLLLRSYGQSRMQKKPQLCANSYTSRFASLVGLNAQKTATPLHLSQFPPSPKAPPNLFPAQYCFNDTMWGNRKFRQIVNKSVLKVPIYAVYNHMSYQKNVYRHLISFRRQTTCLNSYKLHQEGQFLATPTQKRLDAVFWLVTAKNLLFKPSHKQLFCSCQQLSTLLSYGPYIYLLLCKIYSF